MIGDGDICDGDGVCSGGDDGARIVRLKRMVMAMSPSPLQKLVRPGNN